MASKPRGRGANYRPEDRNPAPAGDRERERDRDDDDSGSDSEHSRYAGEGGKFDRVESESGSESGSDSEDERGEDAMDKVIVCSSLIYSLWYALQNFLHSVTPVTIRITS